MPIIVAWIGRVLLTVAGEVMVRALVGAGIGLVSYQVLITPVRNEIATRLAGAGPLAQYIGFLGIDVAITIVLSAAAGRAVVNNSKAYFTRRVS